MSHISRDLINAVVIKFMAVMSNLKDGIIDFPINAERLFFCIDYKTEPELIPGVALENQYSLKSLWHSYKHSSKWLATDSNEKSLILIKIILFFVPAYIYRYILKSTIWFYLPLIYISKKPNHNANGELDDPRQFVTDLYSSRKEWMRRLLAIATIVNLVYFYIHHGDLLELRNSHSSLMVLIKMLIFDYEHLPWWHFFATISAGLTFLLWLYSDTVYNNWKIRCLDNPNTPPAPHLVSRLYRIERLRGLSSIFSILLSVGLVLVQFLLEKFCFPPEALEFLPGFGAVLSYFYQAHLHL